MKGASEWKWLLPLLLCGGSAFVYVLPVPPSTAYLWCRMWTAFGIGMVVACLCLSVLSKKKDLLSVDVVLRAFFFVGVLEMLYALLQGMGFLPSGNPYYRFTGSFNNPAVFAMFMSLCIPIGLHFVARSSASFRLPWGILTFCAGISLAFSSSRTGLLAGACSVFIMCVSWSDKVKAFLSDWKKVFFLLAVLALSLGGLYYCRQDSADGRLLAWIVSARMVAERPIIGWGRGGFDAFYMPAQADYFSRHPESSYLLLADNLSHPFNEFLWFAIQYGVVGLAFLLFALGWVLKSVWDGRDVRKRLWISLFSSFFVWSMFSYPFQIPFMRLAMVYLLTVCVYPVFASSRFAHSLALCILGVLLFGVASMTLSYKKEVQWVDVQVWGEKQNVHERNVQNAIG